MSARTSVKVATQTGAAKDDWLGALATGLSEDSATASLAVLANDPGAARLYSLYQTPGLLAPTTQFPVLSSATLASGAVVTMQPDGTVGYNASALNLQHLALGASFTDSFVYTVRMANGALSSAVATVEVAGRNDAPTLAAPAASSFLDDAGAAAAGSASGTLAGADVDDGAVLTYALTGGDALQTAYGTFSFNSNGSYSFAVDPAALDALGAGQNATVQYSAVVSDEHGASSAPSEIRFDLVGANDTAEIGGNGAASVSEDGVLSASGSLSVSDRDAGQSSFQQPASLAGTYGDFSFDAGTGAWSYALRNGDGNVQALASGQTVQDLLTVTSLDGSASTTIAVSIAGADEAGGPPPPADPVDHFLMNNGRNQSGHNVFIGFDSNDVLDYTPNLDFESFAVVDGDTVVTFSFEQGQNVSFVQAILVGYADFSLAQLSLVSD